MPIYEYTCRKCDAHIEIMQKVSDKPLSKHAGCGGKLEKEWSRTGFQFKGSGWYVTDYAGRKTESKEGKESEGKETAAAKDGKEAAAKSGSSADTTPASGEKSKGKASKTSAAKKSAPAAGGD